MRLESKSLAVVVLVLLFGGILFSSALGWWQTESNKQAALFGEGEFAGQPDPADIRGSYTFGDVERNFGVPSATLAGAFGVTSESDPAVFQLKDLESIYADQEFEIGTASVRLFVGLYTGLPYDLSEDVLLPKRAVSMLIDMGTLTDEQVAYLNVHTVTLGSPPETSPGTSGTPSEEHAENDSTERVIRGKTTFQELLDWDVPQETIVGIIGGPMPNPLTVVKTHCDAQGLYFGDIKVALQAEIDKAAP